MSKQIIARVIRTDDYSQFKKLEGNRGVGDRAAKIKAKIIENGYIMCPIIVNENFEVIDGQGRLEALKELGLAVDYIKVEGLGLQHCIAMNAGLTNWKIGDYIASYIELENENYILLDNLMKQYPDINVVSLIAVVNEKYSFGGGGFNGAVIKNGELEITKQMADEARPKLEYISKSLPYLKEVGGMVRYWITALHFCYNMPEIDNRQMASKIQKYHKGMTACANTKTALQELERVYNYRATKRAYPTAAYDKYIFERGKTEKYE